MPTPASAAMVAIDTRGPSECTAAVAARTRASKLRAASLRCSRGRGFLTAAMRSLKPSPIPAGKAVETINVPANAPHEYDDIAFDADVSRRAQGDRDRVLRSS